MSKRVISGRDTRRRHSEALKRELVERSLQPGASVSALAQEHGINANHDPVKNMQVLVTTVGQPGGTIVLGTAAKEGPAFAPEEFPFITTSTLSHWVIGLGLGARADARVMVARDRDVAAGKPAWREIASYSDQVSGSAVLGDSLFTLSTKGSPNGAVYRRDLRATAEDTWRSVCPPLPGDADDCKGPGRDSNVTKNMSVDASKR